MAIIKTGSLTVAANTTAQNLDLGFIPSYFRMINRSEMGTVSVDGVIYAEWNPNMADGTAFIQTATAGAPVWDLQATDGITPFTTASANEFTNTNLTITGITNASQAVVSATNSLAAGDVVSFHEVVGMSQINTLVGTVVSASGSDFTVDIDTSNFGSWTSGGIANVIRGVNYDSAITSSGNTVYAQNNIGIKGLTLGSALMVVQNDVWDYIAMLDADYTS